MDDAVCSGDEDALVNCSLPLQFQNIGCSSHEFSVICEGI